MRESQPRNFLLLRTWRDVARALLPVLFLSLARAQAPNVGTNTATVAEVSLEAMQAAQKLRAAAGLKVEVFASEPLLANPVSMAFDEEGRLYVVETHRRRTSVYDIRNHPGWLDTDFSLRTVEDRLNFFKQAVNSKNTNIPARWMTDLNRDGKFDYHDLEVESERIRVLEDRNHDGRADTSTVFADGFNTAVSGVAAGILVRKGNVYFTCIPDLWWLQDTNGDRRADVRKALVTGFGVHISFGGHDLHGLKIGPDGKLYFSIADRGLHVETEGKIFDYPDTGAVMRCNLDGTDFEVVASGLRNPQELAFDQFGNLWTGDNNGDGGDKARWVQVLEGGDSGWHIGWQHLPKMGPWNSEKLWQLKGTNTAAYIVPPAGHVGHGPAGLTFYPGTGLPPAYDNHFLLCDFPGGVNSFAVAPAGAGYEVVDLKEFVSGLYPVDVDFGVDGGAYVADWIEGWEKTGKGRIFRVFDPNQLLDAIVLETNQLLRDGMERKSARELGELMGHRDMRVRLQAQFALADRGLPSTNTLVQIALKPDNLLARLHAIWGLGQIGRGNPSVLLPLLPLGSDFYPEVRAQFAKVMGEAKVDESYDLLNSLLSDPVLRVRLYAALAIGKLGHVEAADGILKMLRDNADADPYLRHAGVMALVQLNDLNTIATAAKDASDSVRLAALLAMRRASRGEIATFLYDPNQSLVLEAARAINDVPLTNATSQLATLIKRNDLSEPIMRRVLNANFRLGKLENALAMAEFASRKDAPASLRAEALTFMGQWGNPPKRDAVVGLWRPIPAREGRAAGLALRDELATLIKSPDESVAVAAIRAAASLNQFQAGPLLFESFTNQATPSTIRVEALSALTALKDPRLQDALGIAAADKTEAVRKAATLGQAAARPKDALSLLRETLTTGSTSEKQTALQAVASLKDAAGDEILIPLLGELKDRKLAPELMLDVIEAATKRGSPRLKARLNEYTASIPRKDPLAAYRVCLEGGSAEAGQKVFLERAEAACLRCHKIRGEGGEVGPDLTGIGGRQNREYILESILFPNNKIAPGYGSVVLGLKNGTSYAGVLKSEDERQIVLNSPEDGLLTIKKSDVASRDSGLSAMPGEMGAILSKRDLRDLVEFLFTTR